MILVNSSIWVDHFRAINHVLVEMLAAGNVLAHPFVTGEVTMGNLHQREVVIADMQDLPQATLASDPEVLRFVSAQRLFGLGIGYVDAHLLAAVRLTDGASLWTRDVRLGSAARRLGIAAGL